MVDVTPYNRLAERAQELADATGRGYHIVSLPEDNLPTGIRLVLRRDGRERADVQAGGRVLYSVVPRKKSKKGFRQWFGAARRAAKLLSDKTRFDYGSACVRAPGFGQPGRLARTDEYDRNRITEYGFHDDFNTLCASGRGRIGRRYYAATIDAMRRARLETGSKLP